MELMVVILIITVLSTGVYQILRLLFKNFSFAETKLGVLQTVRLAMSRMRYDLREAVEKPAVVTDDDFLMLKIPLINNRVSAFAFNREERVFYTYATPDGEVQDFNATIDLSDMRPYSFSDGQILDFDVSLSYGDSDSFVNSELLYNSKIWVKVTMKVLYTENYEDLTQAQKDSLTISLETGETSSGERDARIREFSMLVVPRTSNWLLHSTQ